MQQAPPPSYEQAGMQQGQPQQPYPQQPAGYPPQPAGYPQQPVGYPTQPGYQPVPGQMGMPQPGYPQGPPGQPYNTTQTIVSIHSLISNSMLTTMSLDDYDNKDDDNNAPILSHDIFIS